MDCEKDSSCIIGEYYTSNAIQEYIAKHYWQLAYFPIQVSLWMLFQVCIPKYMHWTGMSMAIKSMNLVIPVVWPFLIPRM